MWYWFRIHVWFSHGDVIKWKHFPRYWPFLRGIYRSSVNSPPKGQCRGALMFSLICVWINGWVNNREAGDFRRYRAHYDVIVINPNVLNWLVNLFEKGDSFQLSNNDTLSTRVNELLYNTFCVTIVERFSMSQLKMLIHTVSKCMNCVNVLKCCVQVFSNVFILVLLMECIEKYIRRLSGTI